MVLSLVSNILIQLGKELAFPTDYIEYLETYKKRKDCKKRELKRSKLVEYNQWLRMLFCWINENDRLPQKPILALPAHGWELLNSRICTDNFGKRQPKWVKETSQAAAVVPIDFFKNSI